VRAKPILTLLRFTFQHNCFNHAHNKSISLSIQKFLNFRHFSNSEKNAYGEAPPFIAANQNGRHQNRQVYSPLCCHKGMGDGCVSPSGEEGASVDGEGG
jgi:hypothetical protein